MVATTEICHGFKGRAISRLVNFIGPVQLKGDRRGKVNTSQLKTPVPDRKFGPERGLTIRTGWMVFQLPSGKHWRAFAVKEAFN
jgi:hypothetical protein